jgi:hypothetical protein
MHHHTLDSWRENRCEDGLKMTAKEMVARMRLTREELEEGWLE